MRDNRFRVDNVAISITNLEDAAGRLMEKVAGEVPGYVCVSNVRATYIGNRDPSYAGILNNSFLTVPDGKPLEWLAHLAGYTLLMKTSGPDLFHRICDLTENTSYSHFFYGSTPEVIDKLTESLKISYPGITIAGAVSPPFRPVKELADDEIVNHLNALKPTFVWVGLGAPKQEQFIQLVHSRVVSSTFVGIGLAFDYQAGTVKRAPRWMQKSGLEWLYRNIQQPRRFFFLIMHLFFILHKALEILWRRATSK